MSSEVDTMGIEQQVIGCLLQETYLYQQTIISMAKAKYKVQDEQHPYPHIGQLLSQQLLKRGWSHTKLAKELEVSDSSTLHYVRQTSLQVGLMWKAGLVLHHNFFGGLAQQFPVPFDQPEREQEVAALQKEVQDRDARIRDLEKELAIYKEIVLRTKG